MWEEEDQFVVVESSVEESPVEKPFDFQSVRQVRDSPL